MTLSEYRSVEGLNDWQWPVRLDPIFYTTAFPKHGTFNAKLTIIVKLFALIVHFKYQLVLIISMRVRSVKNNIEMRLAGWIWVLYQNKIYLHFCIDNHECFVLRFCCPSIFTPSVQITPWYFNLYCTYVQFLCTGYISKHKQLFWKCTQDCVPATNNKIVELNTVFIECSTWYGIH